MSAVGQKRTFFTAPLYDWFAPDSGRAATPLKGGSKKHSIVSTGAN
jgi:hypothetical protein